LTFRENDAIYIRLLSSGNRTALRKNTLRREPVAKVRTLEKEKARLEREYQDTLSELERLRESLRGEVEMNLDEISPDLYERDKTMALIQSLELRLNSIERALRAIDKGTYGICEKCGAQIDPARLEARPDASLCLKCQSELERLMRRRGREGF